MPENFVRLRPAEDLDEAAVRERLERGQEQCARMISQMVKHDAGLDDDEALLLSVAMVGLAQVTARYWLAERDRILGGVLQPAAFSGRGHLPDAHAVILPAGRD